MAARLSALMPKLVALTLVWILATSTVTFAASARAPQQVAPQLPAAPKTQPVLIVPDVRRQAYVFAKSILEDGGFAWRVRGSVQGYAANKVATQQPAPGTRVVDNGAPTITLHLERNGDYAEHGLPENASSQKGNRIVLPGQAAKPPKPAKPAKPAAPVEPAPEENAKDSEPAEAPADKGRKPAFVVAGAPAEPLDEMPLPARARQLEQRLSSGERPSPELVQSWLYQHAWVVTGAKFGWNGGADALRTLIRVDENLQARFGFGGRSEAVARAALAQVERNSR